LSSADNSSVGTPNLPQRNIERELFELRNENDQLKEKLNTAEVVIAENKRVIASLAEKGDNQAQCHSSMAEWIQDMKSQILKLQDEKHSIGEQLAAYISQNQQLNEEILELHGRRKCELQTMHSSFRRTSEHSDASLIEASFIEADDQSDQGDDFVLVDDDETPDSETCTWEECIACIKNRHALTSNMKHQIRQGIPTRFRPRVWQALLKNKLTIKIGQYQRLSTQRPVDDEVVKQIALDLPRTSRWLSTDNTGKFKEKLRRVLWAYANHNPQVGYCQGLNRIACLALEHLSEEDSFHFLRLIVDHELPADYYTKEMRGIRADGQLIAEILREKCPKLSEHLRGLDMNTEIAATNWLLIIFIDPAVDIDVTLKIWDAFLAEGNKVLIRWVLAIYMFNESRLLHSTDQGQVMQVLRYHRIDQKDFDSVQNLAYNRLNPFSRRYVETIRRKMLSNVPFDHS